MFYRILFKESGLPQFILAVIGSIIGMTLLLSSVQFYLDIKKVLNNNEDLIKPDYLIINKKVTALNTSGFAKSEFTKYEIEDLNKQKFVKSISPFISNAFEVKAFTQPAKNIPAIYTDMFFESLPDEYLDINKSDWKWSSADSIVPIAVPRDYLNLYNFGYALSKGMPQVSGNMISMIKFTLTLNGKFKSKIAYGKIVGFTDRINTILVPYKFLELNNKELSGITGEAPSRLLIEAKDPSAKEIPNYLDSKGYETNKEKLKNSKLNILLNIMMTILSGLSLTIIFLSLMIFTLAFQLLITKKRDKIRTLLYLGYSTFDISKYYILLFFSMNIVIASSALIIVSQLIDVFKNMLTEYNFHLEGIINSEVYICCAVLSLLIIVVNSVFLNIQTSRLIKK